jgi:hypothetical protein
MLSYAALRIFKYLKLIRQEREENALFLYACNIVYFMLSLRRSEIFELLEFLSSVFQPLCVHVCACLYERYSIRVKGIQNLANEHNIFELFFSFSLVIGTHPVSIIVIIIRGHP